MARLYTSTSVDTTLTASLGAGATTCTVADATALLGGLTISGGNTMTLAIDPDTASEEIVLLTGVSGSTLTITRAQAGTTDIAHTSGATVRHVLTSLELTDFETVKSNYISKTTVNAKGDILAATADDTVTRLAVGSNGQVLTADSTTATGIKWAAVTNEVTASSTTTFTNKSIALGSNTVTGTIAEFNTAVTDADLATIAGSETLTNKNVRLAGVDEKTGNYTLVVGDANKLISVNSASNLTVTVPSGLFSVGDIIYVTRTGTGTVTIAASGTTLTSADSNLKLRARYSSAAIICIASNTFRIVGDLAA